MDPQGYDLLEQNEQFIQNIGYLAAIANLNGPFSVRSVLPSQQFKMREYASQVAVGDKAYNGNDYGVVTAVSSDDDPEFVKITVEFPNSIKPDGIENDDYDPIKTEVYTTSRDSAVAGTTQQNSWQKLASIGCLFYTEANPVAAEAPAIVLESAAPTIQEGGPATSLDFNIAGVSVQKKVATVNSGAPVIANGSGVASVPNGNTTGQSITFEVSKAGYNTIVIGPYIVAAP